LIIAGGGIHIDVRSTARSMESAPNPAGRTGASRTKAATGLAAA
jgi:hypothetical protein